MERLHATNNFPEFTGRLCPAPCEASCVLGINEDPVTIERIEYEIVERAWDEGWVTPQLPTVRTGKSVAVVGSGPGRPGGRPAAGAGRPPGDRLRAGGEARRAAALRHPRVQDGEGRPRPPAGPDGGRGRHLRVLHLGRWPAAGSRRAGAVEPGEERGLGTACAPDVTVRPAAEVRAAFDAVVLAGGATLPRDLPVPGRDLDGVHLALEYLKPSNLVQEGALAHLADQRQGQARRHHRRRRHRGRLPGHGPPPGRAPRCTSSRSWPSPRATGWPTTPGPCGRSSCAPPRPTRRAGERLFSVTTTEFVDDGSGAVRALRGHTVEMRTEDGRPVFEEVPGLRVRARVRAGAPGHGLRRHRAPQRGGRARGRGRAAGHRGGRRRLGDQRRRRLRVRGPDPGPEPDRLGHRRGTLVRGGGRPLAHGRRRRCRRRSCPGSWRCARSRRSPGTTARYCARHALCRRQRCLAVLRAARGAASGCCASRAPVATCASSPA